MSVNKRNSEGYYDPTAYEALVKIEREARQAHAFRPMVYICSPLSGSIAANQRSARRYQLCDFTTERFFHLKYGSNRISVSHDGLNTVKMMVEGKISYETV